MTVKAAQFKNSQKTQSLYLQLNPHFGKGIKKSSYSSPERNEAGFHLEVEIMKVERRGVKDEEKRGDKDYLQIDIRLPNYTNMNTRRDRQINRLNAEQTVDEEKDK